MFPSPPRTAALSAILLALGAFSAACGGSSAATADPLAPFREQKLSWDACDPDVVPGHAQALEELGTRVTCAYMRAPIDWSNPGRGELKVALLRVAAEKSSERVGAILFNPGGPGTDGLELGLVFGMAWTHVDLANPVVAPYRRMSEIYDLIGFSPRGTGASTRLYCGSNEVVPFVANVTAQRDPASVARQVRKGELIAEACAKNPLTPFIQTDATVRDMDLVRHLLGDPKLNYFGISYGTWLGDWYARTFPERVGRMMLSGMVNLETGLLETFLNIGSGMQYVIDFIVAPYAARYPEAFELGTDPAAIRLIHRGLPLELQAAVSEAIELTASSDAYRVALTLRVAQVLQLLDLAHPAATEFEMEGFIRAEHFVSEPGLQAQAVEIALFVKSTWYAKLRQETEPVNLWGQLALNHAVVCNDEPPPRTLEAWIEANDRDAALHPLKGGHFTYFPCWSWGGPSVTRPPLTAASAALPILMTQTRYDPITLSDGAHASLAQRPGASLVEVEGPDYSHGVFVPYGKACLDDRVTAYFLHGTQPERETHCQGNELAAPKAAAVK